MENLLSSICWIQGENVLTETLAFLIKNSTECRAAFLSLIDESITNDECTIITQQANDDQSRPDLYITGNNSDWVMFLENKPWDGSTFTSSKNKSNDQISRYAEELGNKKAKKKFLCLLTNDVNQSGLLREILKSEGIEGNKSKEILIKEFYEQKNIEFIVFTWNQLNNKLSNTTCNNPVCEFLVKNLNNCLGKNIPVDIQKREDLIKNYSEIKAIIDQAGKLLDSKGFARRQGGTIKTKNIENLRYCSNTLISSVFGQCYFGAYPDCCKYIENENNITLKNFYFFVIENEKGNDERFHFLTNDILQTECNFIRTCKVISESKKTISYLAPLDFLTDSPAITPRDIAVSVAKIINKLNNIYLRTKKELEIKQKSQEDEAALRSLEEL